MGKKKFNKNNLFWIIPLICLFVFGSYYFLVEEMALGKASLSNAYHVQIDRFSESYLDDQRINCEVHDGTWFDKRSKIGCFDIRLDYDSSACSDAFVSQLESICDGLGAKWFCDEQNIGCKY